MNHYAIVDKRLLDPTLSLAAMGVLLTLSAEPVEGYFSCRELMQYTDDTFENTKKAVRELIAAGYVETNQIVYEEMTYRLLKSVCPQVVEYQEQTTLSIKLMEPGERRPECTVTEVRFVKPSETP